MEIEIKSIYRDENNEVCIHAKCVEPPHPYNGAWVLSHEEMRRYHDRSEQYNREYQRYEKEIRSLFLGEAEVTQEEK